MKTTFLGVRKPTRKEKELHNCDLVFIREHYNGNEVLIWVDKPSKDYGFAQWGQDQDILGENIDDIYRYFNIED